jgi:riboflavin kinase/FMN adenylyltransferase
MQLFSSNNKISEPTCATIGIFDGVHLGHRFLVENLKKTAISSGLKSLVVTFRNHPQNFFSDKNDFKLLTTENEKIDLISELNPDFTLLLDFNKEISVMKAEEFLLFLKNNYSLKKLIIGYNHSFGSDKIRNFEQYKEIGKKLDIEIEQCEPFYFAENQQISSSNIRKLLLDGDIETSNAMLGKNYSLSGIVESGEKNGRKIGFPTANLAISSQKLVPKVGVYSVDVLYKNNIFNGMLYIGNRPTLDGKNQTIEVNIFDFNENIYGENITIFFKKFVREDKKFNSLEELKQQLQKDKEKIILTTKDTK